MRSRNDDHGGQVECHPPGQCLVDAKHHAKAPATQGLSGRAHKAYTSCAIRVYRRTVPARRDRAAGERRSEGSLTMPYAFTTESVEYIRHGSTPYMAKLYKPSGDGPFPMVIDLHGGAWCNGDLADCDPRDQVLAANGFVVAAINFRHGPDGYPTSLQDINYCIRGMKSNAAKLNGNANAVGLSGTSSGGPLAMLAAMRPN